MVSQLECEKPFGEPGYDIMKIPPISLWILSAILLLPACSSKSPSVGTRFPITSGSHLLLPTAEQRILLWGDPDVTDAALEWLRSHHYTNVVVADHGRLREAQVSPGLSVRKAALALADGMHAEFVLLLERETSKEGALIEPHCGVGFFVDMNLRGLSVNSGDAVLQANAHYPHCVELNDRTTRSLICQTFATAWGFRPSGQLDLPSNLMCTAGQTEPRSNRSITGDARADRAFPRAAR